MAKVKIKYVTKLRTERIDSNHKKLINDFIVTEIRDGIPTVWTVPIDTVSDGKSVPESLEPLIGDPFEGVTEPASWVHDVYCVLGQKKLEGARSQKDTHRIFRDMVIHAMKNNSEYGWIRWPWNMQNGKTWQYSRAWIMWAAVRSFNRLKHKDWK
jgi:hypothetical protein